MHTTTCLALRKLCENIVAHDECNIRLGLRFTLVHGASLLHVDGPHRLVLFVVCDFKLKDTVGLGIE